MLESALGITAAVVVALSLLTCAVITFLKGKIIMGILGVFLRILWIIGACRLAKPDSYWARRFYDDVKLARARARFPGSSVVELTEPSR